jgi:hypothetical protein
MTAGRRLQQAAAGTAVGAAVAEAALLHLGNHAITIDAPPSDA